MMMLGGPEFYLPVLEDPLPCARADVRIDVVVRNALRLPVRHLQVLLLRSGECVSIGFTDRHGRLSFDRLPPGEYGIRLQRRGKPVEKMIDVKKGATCDILV